MRMARLFLLLLLLSLSCLAPAWAQEPVPQVGDLAPTLLGKDRDGEIVDLAAYRGKVVIVTFWASWCGPCRRELPVLDLLQKQMGDQWLRIIAVNVQDSADDYRDMMRQMRGFSLLQARDRDGSIAGRYGVRAYPNLWMIDMQGKVVSHHLGYGDGSFEAITAEIRKLLTEEMHRQNAAKAAPAEVAG